MKRKGKEVLCQYRKKWRCVIQFHVVVLGKRWKKMHSKFSCITCIPWPFALQKSFISKAILPPTPKKLPTPPKMQHLQVAWTWGYIGQYLWKVALARKRKNSKSCFCISFSDRAMLAHAGFSHYISNGLKLGRGITGQDQTQGELIMAPEALLPYLDSTQGFRFQASPYAFIITNRVITKSQHFKKLIHLYDLKANNLEK